MWAATLGGAAGAAAARLGGAAGVAAGRLAGVASTLGGAAGDFFWAVAAGRLAAFDGVAFEAVLAGVAFGRGAFRALVADGDLGSAPSRAA